MKLGGDESNAPLEGDSAEDIPPEEMYNLRPRWQRVHGCARRADHEHPDRYGDPVCRRVHVRRSGHTIAGCLLRSNLVAQQIKQVSSPADRIVSFNGTENPTWDVINGDALLSPGRPLPVVVNRNGSEVHLTITPTTRMENGEAAGTLDFIPDYGGLPVVVAEVFPGSPAAAAGLKENDRFIAIGGAGREELGAGYRVRSHSRCTSKLPITVRARWSDRSTDALTSGASNGQVGIRRHASDFRCTPPMSDQQLNTPTTQNIQILRLTGKALGQVFTGQRSVRNTLSGPIGIYQATQKSVEKTRLGRRVRHARFSQSESRYLQPAANSRCLTAAQSSCCCSKGCLLS